MTRKKKAGKSRKRDKVGRKPSRAELATGLRELRERVEALEGASRQAPAPPITVTDLVPALRALTGGKDDAGELGGAIVYAGVDPREDGDIAWQAGRRFAEVLEADPVRSGRLLAALGSPARLDIVAELLTGPVGRRELRERLGRSTAGQLNHHLRELLAAGLVEQPSRGVYQVPRHQVIPILTLLACAADLAAGTAGGDSGLELVSE